MWTRLQRYAVNERCLDDKLGVHGCWGTSHKTGWVSQDGATPLHLAAVRGWQSYWDEYLPTAVRLLEAGADPFAVDSVSLLDVAKTISWM